MSTPAAVPATRDVVILGGGLAGLTLAIQLRQQLGDIDVVVVERNAHPVREAAFKVGESTVEIGARYLADELGLREHLDAEQIRKFGFRFFFSDGQPRLEPCTELGVSRILPTPSWQIDRGRFENFLGQRARELGVEFRDGHVVRTLAPGADDALHEVGIESGAGAQTLRARWLVDASGRAGLLKRKLGLAEPNTHDANAAWWRVEGFVDPNAWSDDADWLDRCDPPDRWRSTNHLCGPGYWFWLIPLASGAHSLGIVCDAAMHPLDTINSHDKAMAWLRTHQPSVARALDASGAALQDFAFLRHYSHGCRQVFSGDRWAITGEAGLFLDPFYSPGTDFIAIANTCIVDLVRRDRAGGRGFAPYAGVYEQLYQSFYENTLTLYEGQYALFGDAQVLPVKVIWDYTFYWSLLAPLYFAGRLTDVAMLGRLRDAFTAGRELNLAMQRLLRAWGERNGGGATQPDGRLLDQFRLDWFLEMNRALSDTLDDAAFEARIRANVETMRRLAAEALDRARRVHPDLDDEGLAALTAGVSSTPALLPAVWYALDDAGAATRAAA